MVHLCKPSGPKNPWISKMVVVLIVQNIYCMKDRTTATRIVAVFFHIKLPGIYKLLQLSPLCIFCFVLHYSVFISEDPLYQIHDFQILLMKSILNVNYVALC